MTSEHGSDGPEASARNGFPAEGAQPRILVVDDEPIALELARMALTRAGYDPIVARGGPEGLEKALQESIALVLLDITMPEMDGFEVFRRLRDNPATESVPVIFVTARDDMEYRDKGLELGAIDYVTKPYNPSELVARVQITLRLQKLERMARERATEEAMRKAVETLLITISHYINNALAAIQGREEITPSDNVEMVERLKQVTRRQLRVVRATIDSIEEMLRELRVQTRRYASSEEAEILDIEEMVRRRIQSLEAGSEPGEGK